MTMLMQEPGFNYGPSVTVSDPDLFPEESQRGYNDLHRPSYSAVSTAPPSYTSSDGQTAEWWDVEAERILRGSNFQAIQLLVRFRPYADESLPQSILSKRWIPRLNTFLRHLGLEEDCRTMVDPDVDSKVEEILKRLVSSPTSDSQGYWTPQKAIKEPDASRIASELNEASFMEFKRISYPNLVRQALYPDDYVDAVEDFIDWHNGLLEQIRGHLKIFPDEIGKYDQIERELRTQSPAHWAVSQSLQLVRSNRPPTDALPQPTLDFILCPLRELSRHRNAVGVLEQHAVLEVRFRRSYLYAEDIDWTRHFRTKVHLFKHVTKMPSQDLADQLIERDLAAFRSLPPQSIIDEDARFQRMNRRWDRQCLAISEFLIPHPHLIHKVIDVCKLLRERRNFNSLFAFLQALREASCDEANSQNLFDLLNPARNYAFSREIKARGTVPPIPASPHRTAQTLSKDRFVGDICVFGI